MRVPLLGLDPAILFDKDGVEKRFILWAEAAREAVVEATPGSCREG